MLNRTLVLPVVSLGLVLMAAALDKNQAHAGDYYYCNWVHGPHQCCDPGNNYNLPHTENRAKYPGAGTIRVRANFRNSGGPFNIVYGWNYASTQPSFRTLSIAVACNASDWSHTVYGRAFYDFFGISSQTELTEPSDLVAQQSILAVLRRPLVLGDKAPDALFESSDTYLLGWDVATVRRAFRDHTGASYFVVPGARVCLARDGGPGSLSITCNRTADVAGGLVMMMQEKFEDLSPRHIRISGIAPDGVARVALQLTWDHPIISAEVSNNVWTIEVVGNAEREPASLRFVDEHGVETQVLPRQDLEANRSVVAKSAPKDNERNKEEAAEGCAASAGGNRGAAAWPLVALLVITLRRRSPHRR